MPVRKREEVQALLRQERVVLVKIRQAGRHPASKRAAGGSAVICRSETSRKAAQESVATNDAALLLAGSVVGCDAALQQ